MNENRFSIKVFDFKKKIYKQYFFFEDTKDIENKIFHHIMNFLKCSKFDNEFINQMLNKNLTSICHKVNMVKYHLKRYREIEDSLIKKYDKDIKEKGMLRQGDSFILEPELIAQEEAFLFQIKASLDFLMDFVNQIYRRDEKNVMKQIHTFENKGLDLIKIIEKYIKLNKDKEIYLKKLLEYLKTECVDSKNYEDGSLNWLDFIIRARDTISHYQISGGSLQISINNDKKIVIPPYFTRTQRIIYAFDVAYCNLLTFIEDFIALLIGPYLNDDYYCYFTYETDKVKADAPKWYIMLKNIKTLGLNSLKVNPSVLKFFYDDLKPPIDFIECLRMHMYYLSFYK